MGCFLLYTDEDLVKTELFTSLDSAYEKLAEEPKNFIEALADERHLNHRLAMSTALRGMSDSLPPRYREAFIESLKNLCRVAPTIVGLVHNYSYRAPQRRDGRGQSQTTILDKEIKDWRAAEVVSAEAIRRRESSPGNGNGSHGKLSFNPTTDRLDFQQKFQAHTEKLRSTSVEADFVIRRTVKERFLEEDVTILVDTKHSKSGPYSTGSHKAQLQRIVAALSEGSISEFHFVTKNEFGKTFKEEIEKANIAFRSIQERARREQGVDEKSMGTIELREFRENMRAGPKILWHEDVWLDGFR